MKLIQIRPIRQSLFRARAMSFFTLGALVLLAFLITAKVSQLAGGIGLLQQVVERTPGPEKGHIAGTVKDPSGAIIPGVEVTLTMIHTGTEKKTLTNMAGSFVFEQVPAGKYRIKVYLPGFKIYQKSVNLHAGEFRHLNVTLEVGQISESVTVAAAPGPVQVEESRLSSLRGQSRRESRMGLSGIRVPLPKGVAPEAWRYDGNFNTEAYDHISENVFIRVSQDPRSTFSIDVDTASYSNVRRFLQDGELPPRDAVRIEELINYFPYRHPAPSGRDPLAVNLEVASAPWNPDHRLLSVGIQGRVIDQRQRPPGNYVFLLDVSGSMNDRYKLPLVKAGLRYLVEEMRPSDRVAMVVYAGSSGLVLPSTPGSRKPEILQALTELQAGGSTNGGQGIELAYKVAAQNFIPGGVNRVILATDGDFNVGVTNTGELVRLIKQKAAENIFLTVLGFGTGNLKDSMMEKLSNHGNGNYAYIDSLREAHKVMVEEIGGTLVTIAKDVKIQLEFNPLEVEAFRLIGYENRLLAHQDFEDDKKDAGDVGAGHSLTVLYELIPCGERAPQSEPLKYQQSAGFTGAALTGEMLTAKLRYKEPESDRSQLMEATLVDDGRRFKSASDDFRFAAAVAAFGMLLRESRFVGETTFNDVRKWAKGTLGEDEGGYRHDFLATLQLAADLPR